MGALAVKNLDGTHWEPREFEDLGTIPWTSDSLRASLHSWEEPVETFEFGWPWRSHRNPLFDLSTGKPYDGWPLAVTQLRSVNLLCLNTGIGILLIVGTMVTIRRWHETGVVDFHMSMRAIMALMALVSCNIVLASSDDFLWTYKPLATGVLFVGIFLTCFAVIDWIGSLWSLATRRLSASSASAE